MNKLNKIAQGFAFAASLAVAGSAMAATQGSLGDDSTGTSDISLTIVDKVQVTNMKDIPIGSYTGSGDLTPSTSFCVYRNGGDDYKLTLSSSTGAFQLDSALASESIPFSVKVDDDLDATDGESVTYNTETAVALSGAATTNCGGSDNASMALTFAEADLQAASSSNDYQATMTVFVEPI